MRSVRRARRLCEKSGTGATYRATVGGAKNDVVLNGDGNENDY